MLGKGYLIFSIEEIKRDIKNGVKYTTNDGEGIYLTSDDILKTEYSYSLLSNLKIPLFSEYL